MEKFKTIIIAEAGVNHNGSIDIAKKLIDVAADAGADYVKFQTFKADKVATIDSPVAEYQKKSKSNNQHDLLKKLELNYETHIELIQYCKQKKIQFLSSAFDLESIDLLHKLGIKIFKIPSGEITNLPYLIRIAKVANQVIMSTGMCNLNDIEVALKYFEKHIKTNTLTLLQCNTEYPTPYDDVNLNTIQTLQNTFNVDVGFSDHSLGIEACLAAVALGAKVIEKHFTIDKNLNGPDHAASLNPTELKQMIKSIRIIEKILGDGIKKPSSSESKNIKVVRRSIHLNKNLNFGSKIKEKDLIMLRPGDGISPMSMNEVVGKTLKRDIQSGYKLKKEDFE